MIKLIKTVNPIGRYNQLRLSVDYQLGGMNYFSGNINPRGYYLILTPCNMGNNGFMESTLMGDKHESGFKILLEETKRKSAKRLNELSAKIEPLAEKITALYETKEYQSIAELVEYKPVEYKKAEPVKKSLLNDKLIARFAEVGSQQGESNPLVIAKFFNPCGGQSWYATEYNPIDRIFYGYVSLFGDNCDEWGDFSLDELESIKGALNLGIERDLFCGEKRISEFKIPSLA